MNKQKKGRNKAWAKWNKLQKYLKEEKYYFVNECCFPEAPNASRKKTNISKIFVHMCSDVVVLFSTEQESPKKQ